MPRKTLMTDTERRRQRRFNEAAARCRGKLRPRRRTAAVEAASMRPRPDAAENQRGRAEILTDRALASMRPRPDAAENAGDDLERDLGGRRFNEAAARCRGKRPARQ